MRDTETFSADEPDAPPRSNRGCLIAGIVAGVAVFGLLAAGCVGLAWWGMSFADQGMDLVGDQVAADLADNPVLQEHIGPVTEITVDWPASMAAPGDDEFVFDVVGTKGSGRLQVVTITIDADTEDVVSGTLKMPDGTIHDLFPDGPEGGAIAP